MNPLQVPVANKGHLEIGLRTPQLRKTMSPREVVSLALDLGCHVLEPQNNRLDMVDVDSAATWREALEGSPVRIPSFGAEIAFTDPHADWKGQLDNILALAHALGAGYCFVRAKHTAGVGESQGWELLASRGRYAAELLAQADVRLGIEADPPCFVHTLERQRRAIQAIDHPNVYPNFDPCNLYMVGSDPYEAIQAYGSRIRSGHIKDGVYANPAEHGECAVGEGGLDWERLLMMMQDAGLGIPMFIEHCHEPEIRAAVKHLRPIVDRLKVRQVEATTR